MMAFHGVRFGQGDRQPRRESYRFIEVTNEILESLRRSSRQAYDYAMANLGQVRAVLVGVTVVVLVGGLAYVIATNPAVGATAKSFLQSAVTAASPYIVPVALVGITLCTTYGIYRAWRIRQYTNFTIDQRLAAATRDHGSLNDYYCPILLSPSNSPVKVTEIENGVAHHWYFDRDLLLGWYDNCIERGIIPFNPCTVRPLPFTSRDQIVVDMEAQQHIAQETAVLMAALMAVDIPEL